MSIDVRTQSEKHEAFGRAMWKLVTEHEDFCGSEWSEDALPLAEAAGLCRRVVYDPEKHGDICEAEPGSEIWFWGEGEVRE